MALASSMKGGVLRLSDNAGANAPVTITSTAGTAWRLRSVEVLYSTSVTQTVTITRDSGAGAAWDAPIGTIALSSAAGGAWRPGEDVILSPDDAVVVTAPAGGGGVTVALAVYMEPV